MYLIEVYVTNASLNVNRPFTYCHDKEIAKYCRVKINFAKAVNLGIVSGCVYTEKSREELNEGSPYEILPILEVIDERPVISEELFELASWMSRTTISPFISCLNAMLPKALKTSRKHADPKTVRKLRKTNIEHAFTKQQKEVYDLIHDGMEASEARKISVSIVKKLLDFGVIEEYGEESVFTDDEIEKTSFQELTDDQKKAYDSLISTDKMVSLLFGVTGSGKTEVYLHLARHYLIQDREVLILVPEIALTPQMIERVKQRFNDVVFYHSELSDQERYEQYKRIRDGEVKIVVGTRSSVFMPFHDLGLIIIDEEHDSSYKQDNVPCYHVRNVAFKRASHHHAKVLLASATPSLESYTRALRGDYQMLMLKERINHNLPQIRIVDLEKQIRQYHSYIISKELEEEISDCLSRKKQAIILLNRRGYSPIIKCGNCGGVLKCSDCDIPLNYHKNERVLKCHQCSRTYKVPERCPACGSRELIYYGFGTMRVEEELRKKFPEASIERMDRDSTGKKGSHGEILKRFERHETDILIGTQMIAKGLDYPDVTLVGILNADAGLMRQDYNSAKMTLDLLMQASGRSGRAQSSGNVVIQAFNVDHYVIKAVLNQDYEYFYNIEMNYRSKTGYPPYSHIVAFYLSDLSEERMKRSLAFLEEKIEALPFRKYKAFELPRIMKQVRYRIMIMDKDLLSMLKQSQEIIDAYVSKGNLSHVKIDVDPLYLE